MRERGIPQMSFPAALGSLFLTSPPLRRGRRHARQDHHLRAHGARAHATRAATRPSSSAASPLNYAGNFRLGKGAHFVVEGDEYDTAYFDKGPKFLHYRPRTAILTSVEFDHADIYRDLRALRGAFEKFVALLPPGRLRSRLQRAYPNAVAPRAGFARRKVVTYAAQGGRRPTDTRAGVQLRPRGRALRRGLRARPRCSASLLPMRGAPQRGERARRLSPPARGAGARAFDEIAQGLRHLPRREAPAGGSRRGRRHRW